MRTRAFRSPAAVRCGPETPDAIRCATWPPPWPGRQPDRFVTVLPQITQAARDAGVFTASRSLLLRVISPAGGMRMDSRGGSGRASVGSTIPRRGNPACRNSHPRWKSACAWHPQPHGIIHADDAHLFRTAIPAGLAGFDHLQRVIVRSRKKAQRLGRTLQLRGQPASLVFHCKCPVVKAGDWCQRIQVQACPAALRISSNPFPSSSKAQLSWHCKNMKWVKPRERKCSAASFAAAK